MIRSPAERAADLAAELGLKICVAESLTGGLLSSQLAQVEGSSDWFRGGIVAYASDVKFDVLGVRPGPVISSAAAEQMALGALRLFEADVAVALTGVGGPGEQDGQLPGTVWLGISSAASTTSRLFQIPGAPGEVCAAACLKASEQLEARLVLIAGDRARDAGNSTPPRLKPF